MALLYAAYVVLLLSRVYVHALFPEKRQTTSRYCSPAGVCYAEIESRPGNPTFRIAIPDGSSPPFETLLQIISPASFGWAGFAWGGAMTLNPLAVAWPNGDKVMVSSRWATSSVLPTSYSGATYTTLSSSKNSTHWTVEVLCSGCSKWTSHALSPGDVNTFAWAVSKSPVSQPANLATSFSRHTNNGMFSIDLSTARVSKSVFQQYVNSASGKSKSSRMAVRTLGPLET